MEKIVIKGGNALHGTVGVSGMKNAALPVLFACILVKDKCVIENVPDVRDVAVTLEILSKMGAVVRRINKNSVCVDCTHLKGGTSDYELVRKIRASYYLLGAELGRFHRALLQGICPTEGLNPRLVSPALAGGSLPLAPPGKQ